MTSVYRRATRRLRPGHRPSGRHRRPAPGRLQPTCLANPPEAIRIMPLHIMREALDEDLVSFILANVRLRLELRRHDGSDPGARGRRAASARPSREVREADCPQAMNEGSAAARSSCGGVRRMPDGEYEVTTTSTATQRATPTSAEDPPEDPVEATRSFAGPVQVLAAGARAAETGQRRLGLSAHGRDQDDVPDIPMNERRRRASSSTLPDGLSVAASSRACSDMASPCAAFPTASPPVLHRVSPQERWRARTRSST